jgi:hypothetical protein
MIRSFDTPYDDKFLRRQKMSLGKNLSLSIVCLFSIAASAKANKSVFIISRHINPSTCQAYAIEANQVTCQDNVNINSYNPGAGAVDIEVWPEKQLMFVTYEDSDRVVWSSTRTFLKVGEFDTDIPAPGCSGISIDPNKQKIYIVRRENDDLYVYSFDEPANTLVLEEHRNLVVPSGILHAWGTSLDESNDLLYVSTDTERVHVYNTGNWTHHHYIDISVGGTYREAVGIAVDPNRGYIYTGDWDGHTYLVRTNTTYPYNSIEVAITKTGYPSKQLLGVDVDEETGLVYCTTYHHDFRVYDSNLNLKDTETYNISGPAGVAVGGLYKPPLLYLDKVDVNEPNSVLPGDYITYMITYGPNDVDHNNVRITDYLPCKVNYEDLNDTNYDIDKHTYTWQIGSLDASEDNNSVMLTVRVNDSADPNGIITNYCEIETDTACTPTTANTNIGPWSLDSNIIYVDCLSPCPPGTGMTWGHAYTDLEDALARARGGNVDEIKVAKGVYKPSEPSSNKTFSLVNGVKMYGGFPTGGGQRDWLNNETILKKGSGTVSYVVTASGVGTETIIDGFTIRDADHSGIYCYQSYPTVSHVQLIWNDYYGLNCSSSIPTVENCVVHHNQNWGGIYCNGSTSQPVIRNSTIANNVGYGIYRSGGTPSISNCIIWDNGDDLYGCSATYSCIEDINSGQGNIHSNPLFVDEPNNNYHLRYNSPCIDRCNPTYAPDANETDIDGQRRRMDGDSNNTFIVDMGADEYCHSVADFDDSCDVDLIDFSILAAAWGSESGNIDYNEKCDLEDDNVIDTKDLGLFCDEWLGKMCRDEHVMYMEGEGDSFFGGEGMEFSQETFDLEGTETAYETEPAPAPEMDPNVIEEMLEWLDETWQSGQLEGLPENEYLQFRTEIEQLGSQ